VIRTIIGAACIISGAVWLAGTFTRFYVAPNFVYLLDSGVFSYLVNLVLVVFQAGLGLFLIIDKWRPKIWWFVTSVATVFVVVMLAYFISRGDKPAFGIGA
jgi:hypothetical protein